MPRLTLLSILTVSGFALLAVAAPQPTPACAVGEKYLNPAHGVALGEVTAGCYPVRSIIFTRRQNNDSDDDDNDDNDDDDRRTSSSSSITVSSTRMTSTTSQTSTRVSSATPSVTNSNNDDDDDDDDDDDRSRSASVTRPTSTGAAGLTGTRPASTIATPSSTVTRPASTGAAAKANVQYILPILAGIILPALV